MRTALVRTRLLDLDAFSRVAGIHPDLARRLVTLGIIEATRDARGALCFERDQVAVAARVQRLRAGFGLNYAAVALVAELLDRITDLERQMRMGSRSSGG
jgi:hypothetical protein